MTSRFAIETAGAVRGAVAVIRVSTNRPERLFEAMGVPPVPVGDARVRRVFGVDEALVARPVDGALLIMPHGGRGVVRVLAERLSHAGLEAEPVGPGVASGPDAFPEAEDEITARVLAALARAASPLAIDLLLDQPRRWRGHAPGDSTADARVLGRLLRPPVIAAVGAPNIGKSSLLNAVAGGSVALAFDRPGTTRDAVGVLVEVSGVVARWVDTPGFEPGGDDPDDRAARARVRAAIASADLVLRCVDAGSESPGAAWFDHPATMVIATRADRTPPAFDHDVATSAASGVGIGELSCAIRQTLLPDAVLADPRPWRFWDPPEEVA